MDGIIWRLESGNLAICADCGTSELEKLDYISYNIAGGVTVMDVTYTVSSQSYTFNLNSENSTSSQAIEGQNIDAGATRCVGEKR